LELLIEKLNEMVPDNSKISESSDYGMRPRKSFSRIIETALRNNGESTVVRHVHVKIWSHESFKRAEEGLAENAARIQIVLKAGTPTGQKIGELSYYSAGRNDSVYTIFLRRNVVVSVADTGPMEVPKKATGAIRRLEDPELESRCEGLAKTLDDYIVTLTRK